MTELCLVSAGSRPELVNAVADLRIFLLESPDTRLLDVAHTLGEAWQPGTLTLAIVASSAKDLAEKLETAHQRLSDANCTKIRHRSGIFFFDGDQRLEGRLAFMFPGEGSQYVNMLKDVCVRFPEARHGFDLVDRACQMEDDGFVPSQTIFPPPQGTHGLQDDSLWGMVAAIEAVSAAGAAFRLLFEQLEIVPDAVVGHSSGEFMALETAGILRLADDEERVAFIHEGYVQLNRLLATQVTSEGVLLAVGGVELPVIDELLAQHPDQILVAIDNCPHQYILCAHPGLAEEATAFLVAKRAIVEALPFRRPYHTHWFEDTLGGLRELFAKFPLNPPLTDIYSCASADRFPDDLETITELCVTQWARPVGFRKTVEKMYDDGVRFFIEIGPRGNLTSFVADILGKREHLAVASDRTGRNGMIQLNETLGLLAAQGVSMSPGMLFRRRGAKQIDLTPGITTKPASRGMVLTLSPALLPEMSAEAIPPRKPRRQPAPAAAEPIASVSGNPVVSAYFDTMETFLAAQKKVMDQVFGGAAQVTAPAPVPEADQPDRTDPSDHGFPMLGTIERHEPGVSLASVQQFSLENDLFLNEHAFPGTSVSFQNPSLLGLPIMPLTFSLEMIAEAASALAPGRVVVGMKDIRATRWVSFAETKRAIRVTARILSTGDETEVRAEIRDAEGGKGKFKIQPTLVEATVILAEAYRDQFDHDPHTLDDERPCHWTSETIYPDNLFHGPNLQGIVDMTRWGSNGMEGTIRVMSRDGLFRTTRNPRFAVDPVLLDSLGAMLYIWLDCEGPWKQRGVVLPFRAVEFRFNTPLLKPGTDLKVKLRVVTQTEMSAAADIRAIDGEGRVVMDTMSWEGRTFDLGPFLHGVFHTPTKHYLSEPLDAPTIREIGGGDAICHVLDSLSMDFMKSSHGVWQTTIAYSIFDQGGREIWKGLSDPEEARIQWLLESAAAKDVTRHYLAEHHGLNIASPDVIIKADEAGALTPTGDWEGVATEPLRVYVARSHHIAVALIARAEAAAQAIAVDAGVDPVTDAVTPDETRLFAEVLKSDPQWVQRIACAKRALGALPSRVIDIDTETGVVKLDTPDGETRTAITATKGPAALAVV